MPTFNGGPGDDVLTGGADDDVLLGNGGNDTLIGNAGNDFLNGGDGNDVYRFGRGDGQDLIDQHDLTAGKVDAITFDSDVLPSDVRASNDGDSLFLYINGTADRIQVDNHFFQQNSNNSFRIEQVRFINASGVVTTTWDLATIKAKAIIATSGNDALHGYSDSNDAISGLEGNDSIQGYAGNDTLDGGIGDDALNGGTGGDSLTGGIGNDSLQGDEGNDTLAGSAGIDALLGGAGNDTLTGGAGNDSLNGGDGNDVYRFGRGDGQDYIDQNDLTAGEVDAITFNSDVAPSDVRASNDGDSLYLYINGTADRIQVDNHFFQQNSNNTLRIEEVRFINAMGVVTTTWDLATIKAKAILGTSADDALHGYSDSNDVINGLEGNDSIQGYAGNDTLDGGTGDDALNGGTGGDSLTGGIGNDSLLGGTGDDTLIGSAGNDVLLGGDGSDIYRFVRGDGQDYIDQTDSIAGEIDAIVFGSDVLPADVRAWNDGDSLYLYINGTADRIQVDNHFAQQNSNNPFRIEEVRFTDATGAVTAVWDLATIKAKAIIGTTGHDVLYGYSDTGDTIRSLAGNDIVYGFAGNDTLDGGTGDDQLYGDTGNDMLAGGTGADMLVGGDGVDYARYDAAAAAVTVDLAGTVALSGEAVGDTFSLIEGLFGSAFGDQLYGDGGANDLLGLGGNDLLSGRAGNDNLYGGTGDDNLDGGDGNDYLFGDAGADALSGGNGNDQLYGGAGADALVGGAGTDNARYDFAVAAVSVDLAGTVHSGEALGDTLSQIEGLFGSAFNDFLYGNGGANELMGRDGNDTLSGRAGNDNLYGGAGGDTLDGGDGMDYARYDVAAAAVTVDLAGSVAHGGEAIGDTFSQIEGIFGSAFNDALYGNGGANDLQGGAGNDSLYGRAGADSLFGGAGIDSARYDTAAAAVTVDLAGIVAHGGEAVGDTFNLVENIFGSAFGDQLYGDGGGNDLLGLGGNDLLSARAGNDNLYGGNGDDALDGGDGNDSLFGDAGGDSLAGGNGNDQLYGGTGADAIVGGAGTDNARYDFAASAVTVDLAGTVAYSGEAVGDALSQVEGLFGSAFNDALYGDALANTLQGGGGNDSLYGRAGADALFGGAGSDNARYDTATAAVIADLAGIVAHGGEAVGDTFNLVENIYGSAFGDQLYGDGGANALLGLNGNDALSGRAGLDNLYGGNGDDTLDGGDDNDSLFGDAGADSLTGGNGNDQLYGGVGADALIGGAGTDYARYDFAAAAVTADLGSSVRSGEAIGDTYSLVEGLIGSGFNDQLYGDAGANDLQGRDGNDTLDGRGGADTLSGGNGDDDFVFTKGEANGDRISDFKGRQALGLDDLIFQGYGAGATFVQTNSTTWQINYTGGSETLTFTNGAQIVASDYTFV